MDSVCTQGVQLHGRNTAPCGCLFALLAAASYQAERLFKLAFNRCWPKWSQTLGHACCDRKECENKLEHGGLLSF
jgi:hypothetical protein